MFYISGRLFASSLIDGYPSKVSTLLRQEMKSDTHTLFFFLGTCGKAKKEKHTHTFLKQYLMKQEEMKRRQMRVVHSYGFWGFVVAFHLHFFQFSLTHAKEPQSCHSHCTLFFALASISVIICSGPNRKRGWELGVR